jgi:photosystem I reaction center subunit XII
MLTDNQVFLALFSALVTSVLAIRLAATLYQ